MRYLIGRLVWAVVILLGTTSITFAIVLRRARRSRARRRRAARRRGDARHHPARARARSLAAGAVRPLRLARSPTATSAARTRPASRSRRRSRAACRRRRPLAGAGLAVAIVHRTGRAGSSPRRSPAPGSIARRWSASLAILSAPVFWLGMLGALLRRLPLAAACRSAAPGASGTSCCRRSCSASAAASTTRACCTRICQTSSRSTTSAPRAPAASAPLRLVGVHALRNARAAAAHRDRPRLRRAS